MGRKKQTNTVLAGNNNGGLHSARGLATLKQVLTTHDLKDAVLYQVIFTGTQDKGLYQNAIKALMRHIRTKCRAEYIGGYEVGDEKGGLHAHCYIIIETSKHFPADLLDVREGQFLHRLANRKDKEICIRIEPPKNRMHGGQMFARMNTPEKLADCVKWASYYLKPRSKDAVPGRETYFGSEFTSNITKREAQRQKHRDALTKSSRPAPVPPTAPAPAPSVYNFGSTQLETRRKLCPLTTSNRYVRRLPSLMSSWQNWNVSCNPRRMKPALPSLRLSVTESCGRSSMRWSRFSSESPQGIADSVVRQHSVSSSKLVPYDLPRKPLSYLGQKILDRTYGLAHNSSTIFRPSGEQK